MSVFQKLILVALTMSISAFAHAQADDTESLKIAALQALMSAPPERALPIVTKVLNSNGSDELKKHALFVLGQIDLPEARTLLIETARNGSPDIRHEAIRAIGIGGDANALAELAGVYDAGDRATRDAVLQAYLIADDGKAIYDIAAATDDPDEFERAVEILGAMGAMDELRALRDRTGMGEALINAYAVAGDVESLKSLATDSSDPERQAQAMHGLGIAGGDEVAAILIDVYRNTDVPKVKGAALDGLMIAGDDKAILELFSSSKDSAEKRKMLQLLVTMDSDAVWDIIDTTLDDGQ